MSTVMLAPPQATTAISPRLWTCDEFWELGEKGWFEGEKAILVDGVIYTMSPINHPHEVAVGLVADLMRTAFGPGHWVREEKSIHLGLRTDPQPDVAVVRGSPRSLTRKPSTALLIVEVSDSTLGYDLGEKADLYASADIADYWVVDLVHRQLIIHRDPVADATRPRGFRYSTVTPVAADGTASPLAAPTATVLVADLLP